MPFHSVSFCLHIFLLLQLQNVSDKSQNNISTMLLPPSPSVLCACNNTIENAKLFISGDFDWRTLSTAFDSTCIKNYQVSNYSAIEPICNSKRNGERQAGAVLSEKNRKKANTPKCSAAWASEDKEYEKPNAAVCPSDANVANINGMYSLIICTMT